jgi:hypothetical protein
MGAISYSPIPSFKDRVIVRKNFYPLALKGGYIMSTDLLLTVPILVGLTLLRIGIPLLLIWLFSKAVNRLLAVLP